MVVPPEPVADVHAALDWLQDHATRTTLDGMARYGIPSEQALGVAMRDIKALGKRLGRRQELAAELWDTGVYEARMLTSFVGEAHRIAPAEMNRWCHQFDSWAICDTLCFNLFDRTPHAWVKVTEWSQSDAEFVKRAAFALLWSLSAHDKTAGDDLFIGGLELIERAAGDDRNFVRKAVNMALRAIGKRNGTLHAAAVTLARQLAASSDSTTRWIGKDALRGLENPTSASKHPNKPGRLHIDTLSC